MNQNAILDQLSSLTPEQRELALRRLRERKARSGKVGEEQAPIRRADRDAPLPLSFGQRRLWFLDQMEGPNPHYNEFGAYRIRGDLDENALDEAFHRLIERHEILRTTFPAVDGEPVQRIAERTEFSLRREDAADAGDWEAQLRARMQEEAGHLFDLGEGPLMRATLIRCPDGSRLLMTVLHHIICDNWSSALFSRDLISFYRQCARNDDAALPALAVQYADFAVWQRESFSGRRLKSSLDYWRGALEPLPAPLELPLDFKRPPQKRYDGFTTRVEWDEDRTQALRKTSRAHGASLFMTMLAAYAVTLARFSCQERFLIGVPVTTRGRSELEPLIGFFVNTLVLKMDLRGNPSFRELIPRVVESVTNAFEHQDMPLDRLIEALQVPRDAPLLRAMLIFQNAPKTDIEMPGLALEPVDMPSQAVRSDVDLYIDESEGRLLGTIRSDKDLFSTDTMARFSRRLATVVDEYVLRPETTLDELRFDRGYRLPAMQRAEAVLTGAS